jgi:hypothetical protein
MAGGHSSRRDELLAYIRREGHKPPVVLRGMIQHGYHQLLAQLDGLTDEQVAWSPDAKHPSIAAAGASLVERRRACARICDAIAHGRPPELDSLPPHASSATADWLRLALESTQDALLKFIDGIWPHTDLATRWDDRTYGALNCKEWLVRQRIADADCAARIARIRALPGFPLDAMGIAA